MTAMTGYLSIPGQINEMCRVRGDRMDPRIAFPSQQGIDLVGAELAREQRYRKRETLADALQHIGQLQSRERATHRLGVDADIR